MVTNDGHGERIHFKRNLIPVRDCWPASETILRTCPDSVNRLEELKDWSEPIKVMERVEDLEKELPTTTPIDIKNKWSFSETSYITTTWQKNLVQKTIEDILTQIQRISSMARIISLWCNFLIRDHPFAWSSMFVTDFAIIFDYEFIAWIKTQIFLLMRRILATINQLRKYNNKKLMWCKKSIMKGWCLNTN